MNEVKLPIGTRYAILNGAGRSNADKKTARMAIGEELAKWQRVRPIMNEILQSNRLAKIAEAAIRVTGLKGPLEGWQAFAGRIRADATGQVSEVAAVRWV